MFGISNLREDVKETLGLVEEIHCKVFIKPPLSGCKKECSTGKDANVEKLEEILNTLKIMEEGLFEIEKRFEVLDTCLSAICKKIYEPAKKEPKKVVRAKKTISSSSKL